MRLASSMLVAVAVAACGRVDTDLPDAGGSPDAAPPSFRTLWVPQYNLGQVRGYAAARTLTDGEGPPEILLTLPAGCQPNAVAFDPDGDLWVTCNGTDQLLELGASSLVASGTPTPKTTLTSDGATLKEPIGLVFDGGGNVWVACADRVELYRAPTLAASGSPTPDRSLIFAGFDLPAGLLLDGGGNLWVANASFTPAQNSVLVFTTDALAAGGIQTPRLTITSTQFDLVEGLAFDRQRNLWVASNNGGVARFSAADLVIPGTTDTRTLTPGVQLLDGGDPRTVRDAGGLVFDDDGHLYVTSQLGDAAGDDARVLRFSAAVLAALSGDEAAVADVVIGNAASSPGFGGLALR